MSVLSSGKACSTSQQPYMPPLSSQYCFLIRDPSEEQKKPRCVSSGVLGVNPGDDLLSHGLGHTTIGAAAFHFRVRDGIGWCHSANFTRETVGAAHCASSAEVSSEKQIPAKTRCLQKKKTPLREQRGFRVKTLAMTYSRMA